MASTLHIGMDDTDSIHGMCTTYLAYRMVHELADMAEFLDYPRLVRLNPNIPYKTRGNGAVSISVRTDYPDRVRDAALYMIKQYSDTEHGANPGLAICACDPTPAGLGEFADAALCRLVRLDEARRFASRYNLETFHMGSGRGLVGAMSAISYRFVDCTAEMLCYRRPEMFGTQRTISAESVRKMQEHSYPDTFGSYDTRHRRILMAPHGPDPVFYGLRGEDPASLYEASKLVKFDETLEGHMIFRSNQGTGDHLRNAIPPDTPPFASGTLHGTISQDPVMHRGGYVTFVLVSSGMHVPCIVYRPTDLSGTVMELTAGDEIIAGGGIRRATSRHPRILNVEFVEIIRLVQKQILQNPQCARCNKSMKSKGAGQGFGCIRCGNSAPSKVMRQIPRSIKKRTYLPAQSAHRHLTRPAQRRGLTNKITFDDSLRWFAVY